MLMLTLAVCAATVMDFILFESIKKIGILKFEGQRIVAEVVEENDLEIKLKYIIDDKDYFLNENKESLKDLLKEDSKRIELIFDKSYPEGAVTVREFKRLDSFFILFVLGFVVTSFAIFIFIQKIFNVYRFYTDDKQNNNDINS